MQVRLSFALDQAHDRIELAAIGYPGWLWTYGLPDNIQKGDDDKRILNGDPSAPDLVRKYGVDYVMIGPQEIPLGASRAYWDEHGTLVYDNGEYAVYKV